MARMPARIAGTEDLPAACMAASSDGLWIFISEETFVETDCGWKDGQRCWIVAIQSGGVGVFWLLMLGIALFAAIIIAVMNGTKAQKVTRTGEKLMFGAIIVGVVVAVVFASLQMLSGVLF